MQIFERLQGLLLNTEVREISFLFSGWRCKLKTGWHEWLQIEPARRLQRSLTLD